MLALADLKNVSENGGGPLAATSRPGLTGDAEAKQDARGRKEKSLPVQLSGGAVARGAKGSTVGDVSRSAGLATASWSTEQTQKEESGISRLHDWMER